MVHAAHIIALLLTDKDQFVRTSVTVRVVVVKYVTGVMGMNWSHLPDGSRNPYTDTHDIATTTLDATAVGAPSRRSVASMRPAR